MRFRSNVALGVFGLVAAAITVWNGWPVVASTGRSRATAAYYDGRREDYELIAELESERLLAMANRLVVAEQLRLDELDPEDEGAHTHFRMLPDVQAWTAEAPTDGPELARWLGAFPAPEPVLAIARSRPCGSEFPFLTPIEAFQRPPWSTLGATALLPGESGTAQAGLRHTLDYRVLAIAQGPAARALIAGVTDLECDGVTTVPARPARCGTWSGCNSPRRRATRAASDARRPARSPRPTTSGSCPPSSTP